MGAFSNHDPCTALEHAPLSRFRASGNPSLTLTRGISALYGKDQHKAGSWASLTLPDGRLNAGTHLGLLARRYRYLSRISEGVTSQVLLVEDTFCPGTTLAVKATHRQFSGVGQQEARAMRFLHSRSPSGRAPGMAKLLDTFRLGGHFCMVTERLYPRMLDWIAESAQQAQQEWLHALRKLAHQLLASVAFLHQNNVVHADLKPDNILFTTPQGDRCMGARVVDFGGSFSTTETDTQRVVFEVQTLQYRAPEALLCLPYGCPIDVWSLGVLLAEAALKRPLLICSTPAEVVQTMTNTLGPLPPHLLEQSPLAPQLAMLGYGGGTSATSAHRAGMGAAEAGAGGPRCAATSEGGGTSVWGALKKVDLQLADLVGCMLCYDPAQRITAAQHGAFMAAGPAPPFSPGSLPPGLPPALPAVAASPLPSPSPTHAASALPTSQHAQHPIPQLQSARAQQAQQGGREALPAAAELRGQAGADPNTRTEGVSVAEQHGAPSPSHQHYNHQRQQQFWERQVQPGEVQGGAGGRHAERHDQQQSAQPAAQQAAQQRTVERSCSPLAWSTAPAQAQPVAAAAAGVSSNCPAADLVQAQQRAQRAQQPQLGGRTGAGIYAGPFSPPASGGRPPLPTCHPYFPAHHIPGHHPSAACPDQLAGPPCVLPGETPGHSRSQQAAAGTLASSRDPRGRQQQQQQQSTEHQYNNHQQRQQQHEQQAQHGGQAAGVSSRGGPPPAQAHRMLQQQQHQHLGALEASGAEDQPQGRLSLAGGASREGTGWSSGSPGKGEGIPLGHGSPCNAASPDRTPLPPSPCRPPGSSRRKQQGPQHLRSPLEHSLPGVAPEGSLIQQQQPVGGEPSLPPQLLPSWMHGTAPPVPPLTKPTAAGGCFPEKVPKGGDMQEGERQLCVGQAGVGAAGDSPLGAFHRDGQGEHPREDPVNKSLPKEKRAGAAQGKRRRGMERDAGGSSKRAKVKREGGTLHSAKPLVAAAVPQAPGGSPIGAGLGAEGESAGRLAPSASVEVAAAALQQLHAALKKGGADKHGRHGVGVKEKGRGVAAAELEVPGQWSGGGAGAAGSVANRSLKVAKQRKARHGDAGRPHSSRPEQHAAGKRPPQKKHTPQAEVATDKSQKQQQPRHKQPRQRTAKDASSRQLLAELTAACLEQQHHSPKSAAPGEPEQQHNQRPGGGLAGNSLPAPLSPQLSVVQQAEQGAAQHARQGAQLTVGSKRGASAPKLDDAKGQQRRKSEGAGGSAAGAAAQSRQWVTHDQRAPHGPGDVDGARSKKRVQEGGDDIAHEATAAALQASKGRDVAHAKHAGLKTPVHRAVAGGSREGGAGAPEGSDPPTRRGTRERRGQLSWWVAPAVS